MKKSVRNVGHKNKGGSMFIVTNDKMAVNIEHVFYMEVVNSHDDVPDGCVRTPKEKTPHFYLMVADKTDRLRIFLGCYSTMELAMNALQFILDAIPTNPNQYCKAKHCKVPFVDLDMDGNPFPEKVLDQKEKECL
jgi:hypothetical protein